MPLYLNKNNEAFSRNLRNEIYVDKSEIISDLNKLIPTDYRFLCVTRPRRFGKTMTLSMLNAYYSKGCDSRALFEDKQIRKDSSFEEHLNKHHVLWLDMAGIFSSLDNKRDFVRRLKYILLRDFREAYPNIDFNDCELNEAFALIHSKTGDRFIFLIDEWDVIFREMPSSDLCNDYIMFLRSLFKASDISSCFDLVYMTGILPIRRYTTESALNMFSEYNMLNPKSFSAYIGFTEEEVYHLCDKHDIDFGMMKKWYNGYHFGKISVYNPKSVVEAITERKFSDYWTSTGALESVTNYMNYDNGELKEVITRMLTGEKVQLNVMKFSNDLTKINSRDAALTVLIHLGYLAYDEETKSAYIPNYEIQNEFETALDELNWKELYNPISNSKKLYEETLKGNIGFIEGILDRNHKELASMFNKNKEDVLGIVVHISYYYANELYYIRKEDTCTTGRADLTFTPRNNQKIPIVIELKKDDTVDIAMKQIKSRNYASVFHGYHGKVLLLAIVYDSKNIKHKCKIEYMNI